jgi:hypothetical protein
MNTDPQVLGRRNTPSLFERNVLKPMALAFARSLVS